MKDELCICGHPRHLHGGSGDAPPCGVLSCECQKYEEPPKSLFVRFQARRVTDKGCYDLLWLVNPEYVSNVEATKNDSWSLIRMNNGNEAYVQGSIDEVEKKLLEAR